MPNEEKQLKTSTECVHDTKLSDTDKKEIAKYFIDQHFLLIEKLMKNNK